MFNAYSDIKCEIEFFAHCWTERSTSNQWNRNQLLNHLEIKKPKDEVSYLCLRFCITIICLPLLLKVFVNISNETSNKTMRNSQDWYLGKSLPLFDNSSNKTLSRQRTLTEHNEAAINHLAQSQAFVRQALAHHFQVLPLLRKEALRWLLQNCNGLFSLGNLRGVITPWGGESDPDGGCWFGDERNSECDAR